MIETDFPVWTVRPNWSDPVVERLGWLTDVLQASNGVEQRRELRLSPRRSFEITFNPVDQERTYLDLWLHRLGRQKLLTPIWHDKGKLNANANVGVGRLYLDTRWREFVAGDLALIHNGGAFETEVVEIEAVDADGLDLVGTTGLAWRKGTAVYPLREAYMDITQQALKALSSRVGEATFTFMLDGPNDLLTGDEPLMTFGGYPVLTLDPNRVDTIDTSFTGFVGEQDQQLGTIFRVDDAERAFTTQSYGWLAHGRRDNWFLRQTLYRLAGRAKAIWLPTFNDDVTLSRPAVAGNNFLFIKRCGYTYVGGPASGRDHIIIRDATGARAVLQITQASDAAGPHEERLSLSGALTHDIPKGRTGSFLDIARSDNDTVELHHHTDTDGASEASVAMRSFKNTRDPSGAIYLPIPAAVMSDAMCGSPEPNANPCANYDCQPECIFHWQLEFNGCNTGYCPTRNWYMPNFDGRPSGYEHTVNPPISEGGPAGTSLNLLSVVNNCNASGSIYERNIYNEVDSGYYHNPVAILLQGQKLIDWSTENGSFTIHLYGALATGGGQLQIQYGPFWCGDFIAIGNLTRTDIAPPHCTPTPALLIENAELVGNVPYTWVW